MNTSSKAIIANAFGAAAEQYDEKACIQKIIAADNIERARQIITANQLQHCLDIGCGTGSSSIQLLDGSNRLTGVDIAPGMIHYAQSHHQTKDAQWLVGDAEQLPVNDRSVDFIYSCMALQWLEKAQQFVKECHRVLNANGRAVLAILSEGSMYELRDTWQENGLRPTINAFLPQDVWVNEMQQCGFDVESETIRYIDWHESLLSVLHSIKDVGAGVSKDTGMTPLTKGQLRKLESAYQLRFGSDKGLPLTYKVSIFYIKKGK